MRKIKKNVKAFFTSKVSSYTVKVVAKYAATLNLMWAYEMPSIRCVRLITERLSVAELDRVPERRSAQDFEQADADTASE